MILSVGDNEILIMIAEDNNVSLQETLFDTCLYIFYIITNTADTTALHHTDTLTITKAEGISDAPQGPKLMTETGNSCSASAAAAVTSAAASHPGKYCLCLLSAQCRSLGESIPGDGEMLNF